MSARLEKLFRRTPGQRRTALALMVVGVIIVPLAIAGLVAGALASADQRLDAVPALVVNNDEMVTATLPDGSEQMILAGRQLVTELTAPDTAGFAWAISNSEQAAAALAAGDAYAVLTIPSDFSAAINSLSGTAPKQADLQIRTDDAHAYLAGSAAQSVGEAMTGAFGRAITTQYLTAFYSGIAEMGASLGTAADGAATLSSGVGSLASGLDSLAGGAASAASGAASLADGASGLAGGVSGVAGGAGGLAEGASGLADGASGLAGGVREYSGGADGIAAGLGALNEGAAGLSQLSDGVAQYTGAISSAAGQLDPAITQGIGALTQLMPTLSPEQQVAAGAAPEIMGQAQGALNGFASGGDELAAQTATAIGGVQGGISQLAGGAAQLAAGSDGLRSGADSLAGGAAELAGGASALAGGASELAGGVQQLADGAGASASGAHQLQGGASELATGLGSGAEQASALAGSDPQATAEVVAEPVGVSLERDNQISSLGQIIGMVFVPVGLWIGALTIFLLMRPVSVVALGSTASTGRILGRGLLRGFALAAAQVLVIVALLHTTLGVSWASLPATLGFSLLIAAAFVAVHHLLITALGRGGVVVSLVLLALQLTSVGGLYPVEILAAPFQLLSPILPLTWAVQGMQAIVAGVGGSAVGVPAAVLAVFVLLGALGSLAVIARRRGAGSFGFALAQS